MSQERGFGFNHGTPAWFTWGFRWAGTNFLDLKKAFDTVNYEIILSKLEHYGIQNTELFWFRNYLSNRQQYVHLSNISGKSNISSCKLPCISGIPQGSCLGPLLFLFFINDLSKATNLLTLLFADDCTFQISCSDSLSLFKEAKKQLKKAEHSFNANELTINSKKSKYILFKDPSKHVHVHNLYMGNSTITRVGKFCPETTVRFLGILIDDTLSFSGHIQKLKAKQNKIVPLKIRKTIYQSLIESHLRFS